MEDVNHTKTPLVQSKSAADAAPADLPAVIEAFDKCRRSDGTLATDHYLAAVNELVRFVYKTPFDYSLPNEHYF